jgi:hypothetical protein
VASFLHPAEMACVSKEHFGLSLERYRKIFLNYCGKFATLKLVSETLHFNRIESGSFYCQRLIQKIIYFVRSHLSIKDQPALPFPIEESVFDANVNKALTRQDRDLIKFFKTLMKMNRKAHKLLLFVDGWNKTAFILRESKSSSSIDMA